jgi:Holliday junction resolvase RusA-like endonuclease
MEISLEILGVPLPWKAAYVGSRGAYSPRYFTNKIIKREIQEAYQGPLIEGALRCDMIFYMPIPKASSVKKRAQMISGEIRPTGTPDITNLRKNLEDLLQGVVMENDSKFVEGMTAKYYGEIPRSVIKITKI